MKPSTLRGLIPVTLVAAFAITGCTNEEPEVSTDTLVSHTWSLVSATNADGEPANALTDGDQEPIELVFQSERMGVANACNNLSGDYKVKGDTLEIDDLAQTMMACEPELMAREDAIKDYLKKPLEFKLGDNNSRLTLSNENGNMVFQANDSKAAQ